jgi:hypothetical protein
MPDHFFSAVYPGIGQTAPARRPHRRNPSLPMKPEQQRPPRFAMLIDASNLPTPRAKNASDIALVIDAMDTAAGSTGFAWCLPTAIFPARSTLRKSRPGTCASAPSLPAATQRPRQRESATVYLARSRPMALTSRRLWMSTSITIK